MSIKILGIIQARCNSTRLKNKVFADISGKPLIERVFDRVNQSKLIENIVIATSKELSDKKIVEWCIQNKINYFCGDENNVLDRFYKCGKLYEADIVVRITSDDPFKDPKIMDYAINLLISGNYDYVSNTIIPTYPEGMDVEVFTFLALKKAYKEAKLNSEKEHVTPFIWKNKDFFSIHNFKNSQNLSNYRWTIDYSEDLDFVRALYQLLKDKNYFSMNEIINLLKKYPHLNNIQKDVYRNEGYLNSITKEVNNE
tara:strand:+ start:1990 stop:2754 length:765 start_codon:yes stop_codon:yes gene_type:complete